MSSHSATRQQLESAVRNLLPTQAAIPEKVRTASSSTASAGLGGLVTGYVWGWLRGHRSRRR